MNIIAFGDVHMDLGKFNKIPEIDKADLIIITGDFTNFGGRKEASQIFDEVVKINQNILALPGNLDQREVDDYLVEKNVSLHGRGKIVDGIGFFGVGGSNITPFKTPIEFNEDELAEILSSGFEQVKEAETLILVSHTPPNNTKTDVISGGIHVGSTAVRSFIEKNQPALCLTGHIHEASAEDMIGNTPIVNPGMIKDGSWVEVTIENGQVSASLKP